MKSIRALFFAVLLGTSFNTLSQDVEESVLRQISPLTPNAASLGKYGDIPVSLYAGIPKISIPLYEIKVGGFTLPISLSYHASGVQVDDVPSWIGTGWTLNAGGMINRRLRGIEDYRMINSKSLFYDKIETIEDPSASTAEKAAAANNLFYGKYDTESDIFSINTSTLSHQFFLDVDGNTYCKPARKLQIIPEGSASFNQGNHIYYARWRVKDETGVEYIFGRTADNPQRPQKDQFEITRNETACGASSGAQEFVNTWYLNEIKLPDGQAIYFEYETFTSCRENTISESLAVNPDFVMRRTSKTVTNHLKALRISEITFPTGKVVFVPGDDRRDVAGDQVLDEIQIFSKRSGGYYKEKAFRLVTNNPPVTTTVDESFRLALLSVTEVDNNGAALEPYVFNYKNQLNDPYSFGLPPRGSYAQDLWGYHNGKIANTHLIPNFIYMKDGAVLDNISGADRSVDTEKAQAGVLTRITYPTKGSTAFFYESNVARGITHEDTEIGRRTIVKTNSTQLENLMGNNDGYGPSFIVAEPEGKVVHVTAEIEYVNSTQCVTTMSAYGSFFDCLTIALEKRGQNSQFNVYDDFVYFDQNYTLPPGEYRVKLTWNGSSQIGSIGNVHLTWNELSDAPSEGFVNPAEDLAAMAIVPTGTKPNNSQLLNTNGTDSGYGPVFKILREGLTDVSVDSHIMYYNFDSPCTVTTPGGYGSFYECLTISLEKKGADGAFQSYNNTVYFDRIYSLEKGEYRIKITWHDAGQIGSWAYVDLQWNDYLLDLPLLPDPNRQFTVGGLRIAKIVDTDGTSGDEIVRWFDYNYDESDLDDSGTPLEGTSGTFQNTPLHKYVGHVFMAGTSYPQQDILTSFSNSAILQTSGGHVGYKKVTVSFGADKKGGRQISYFSSPADYPDGNLALTRWWPQLYETVDIDWRRGLTKKVIDLKYENNAYSSVRETENEYAFFNEQFDPNRYHQVNVRIKSLAVDFSQPVSYHGHNIDPSSQPVPVYSIFKTVSESFYINESVERTKDAQADVVIESTFELNHKNLAVAKKTTNDSRGGNIEVATWYPVDYGNVDNIYTLQAANIISIPVKTETTYNNKLVKGVVVKYTDSGQPKAVYEHEDSNLTLPPPHSNTTIVPSNYVLKHEFSYDATGTNLAETRRSDNYPTAYIWGFDRSFPVVKIENMEAEQIPASLITSIESHAFTGGIQVSDFQVDVDFLNTQVTTLRNNNNYRVTTYTYNTAFGLTSQTDPNGITTYFESDGYGRLKLVRDKDGNIVTSYKYGYKSE